MTEDLVSAPWGVMDSFEDVETTGRLPLTLRLLRLQLSSTKLRRYNH